MKEKEIIKQIHIHEYLADGFVGSVEDIKTGMYKFKQNPHVLEVIRLKRLLNEFYDTKSTK
jgi:hypothetical protein